MKNKELIIKLLNYNLDADVSLVDSEDITISFISNDNLSNTELTPQTTPHIFIEGVNVCPLCTHEYIENDIKMCNFYQKPCKLVEECFQFEKFEDYC